MKIVDLSVAIENDIPADPPPLRPRVEYMSHKDGAEEFCMLYGCRMQDLPEGNGIASEKAVLTTHAGTHVDAPYHFYPTMDGGKPSWTIDQVPLEYRIREQDGRLVQVADYIACMTDRYAVRAFEKIFVPRSWANPRMV